MVKDQEIISLMLNKNEQGMKALYANYSNSIFGIITRTTKNKELAEEVLQTTMLKAWNKIDTYRNDKSSLYTWLATIARNSALDKVRLKSYSNQNKTDSLDSTVYDYGSVNMSQSEMDVKKLINGLDEKYSVLLKLVYLEGFSQKDAAEKLEIPLGTVKTRLRGALDILRKDLKKEKLLFIGAFIIALLTLISML